MRKHPNYEHTFQVKLLFNCPQEKAYNALHQLSSWPRYLPHVEKIDTLYDDGCFQEFWMHVRSKDDKLLTVKSARCCNGNDRIRYFQPSPPDFLQHHAGQWDIIPVSVNKCEVIASHFWNVNTEAAKKAFQKESNELFKHIKALLKEHALFALTTWKHVIESRLYQ